MRPILLYLVLVGVPVLGILALLRVGQTLLAPVFVGGKWDAQLNQRRPSELSGGDPLPRPGPITLIIAQNGQNLRLIFGENPGTTFVGSIQDTTIDAVALSQNGKSTMDAALFTTTPSHFHATVDRQTKPEHLAGVLIVGDGPARTELPMTAMRQGEDRKPAGDR